MAASWLFSLHQPSTAEPVTGLFLHALQSKIFRAHSGLHCRFLQTSEGRYFINIAQGQGYEIPFKASKNLQMQLRDLPSKFAACNISDAEPSNSLLPEFVPQLQPHLMLAGKDAFFKVQLTQLQDGAVLGVAFSHGLTGEFVTLL